MEEGSRGCGEAKKMVGCTSDLGGFCLETVGLTKRVFIRPSLFEEAAAHLESSENSARRGKSDRVRAIFVNPTGHHPLLRLFLPQSQRVTRLALSPNPKLAHPSYIQPVGGSIPFDWDSVASRAEPDRPSEVVGCGARHGGPRRRRRIGVDGRGLGRRPGRGVGLVAHHPAAPLLRLPLPLLRSRGCFGCCDKTVRQLGEFSQSLLTQNQNPTVGEAFWSTSTIEIEPADLRGLSSINTSTWALDQHGVGSSHSPPDYVNHGLFLWKQNRQEWTGNRRQQPKVKQIREPILSWNAAYESLLGSTKPFPQPIPLHEMVDFLVDIWEQEGLYD